MNWNLQMFLQDAWEKRVKRSFVRPRMVILTVFKGNFYSIAVSCVSVLQYRTYARNRIGILKTSHLVKCPHGRCINKSFQSQMMQMRNNEKQYENTNLFTNSGKYIGIKDVKGSQYKTSLGPHAYWLVKESWHMS